MTPVPVRSTPEPKNLVRKGIGYLMVTRTYVLPMPVDGQVVMVIWVSVRPGFRDDAAFLTTERAAAASFCSAIARTPSRAAAEMVPCTRNPRPNSAMPSTSTMSSGTMKANSTALAPRSPRMRFFIPHLTALPGVRRRRGLRGGAELRRTAATRTGAGSARGGELVGDLGEQLVELVAKR